VKVRGEVNTRDRPRKRPRSPPVLRGDPCARGHPFDEENTYVNPTSGTRRCRECERERNREYLPKTRDKRNDQRRERYRAARRLAASQRQIALRLEAAESMREWWPDTPTDHGPGRNDIT
jgi:hypothetical protein